MKLKADNTIYVVQDYIAKWYPTYWELILKLEDGSIFIITCQEFTQLN